MHLLLSDEQQDKVFSILHEAAPQLREQSKAIRKARDALRALGQSADFAAADAARLAQTAGTAEGQLALLHTRIDHDIYVILTADQRSQLTIAQKNGPHRFDDMPPR
jgi:Spy/CpxP family protein refolding chaperone